MRTEIKKIIMDIQEKQEKILQLLALEESVPTCNELNKTADIWYDALQIMKNKVSKPSYETWLKTTKAKVVENDELVILVPNDFSKEWLSNHYITVIQEAVNEVSDKEMHIKIEVPELEAV